MYTCMLFGRFSRQASCLLQAGQLSIYHVTTTSRLASLASWLVIERRDGRSFHAAALLRLWVE